MKYEKHQIENIRNNLLYCKPFTERDIFRVDHNESIEHNLALARQFVILSYEGFCVAVRPKLRNKQRPDLLVLSTKKPICKEVMITETDKRFAEKNYLGINKIKVNGKNVK